ncbi:MAG: NAD(+)/NADH kinase [Candidatus Woesearchaeota archaeon]
MTGLIKKDILVVYKKSTYQGSGKKSKESIEQYKQNHEFHRDTIKRLRKLLKGASFIFRANLSKDMVDQYRLIIPVGGDGTVLDASHFSLHTPILAVNSTCGASMQSVGFFCGATRLNLEEAVDKLFNDELKAYELNRIQVELNNKKISPPVLNEVYLSDREPPAMARFKTILGDAEDNSRGFGILVSTAAGSTSAIKSAGGKMMPIESKKLQYLVLAPQQNNLYMPKLSKGIFDGPIEFISNLNSGRLSMDGKYIRQWLGMDDRIKIYNSKFPLTVYNLDIESRKKNYG